MKNLMLLVLCLILMPFSAHATTLALDFNNDSAEVRADFDLNRDDYGTALLGGRYLYNDDEESKMVSVELKFMGDPGAVPGLDVGAGFIGYIGESYDVYDFSNVGIGLLADYAPGSLQGLGISGRLVYSPSIFSWQDSDGLFEYNLRVNFAITPKVKVYGGYQSIESEVDGVNADVDIDDDFRVGLQVKF